MAPVVVKTVVGTSEKMFHTVSRDTGEGENQVVESVGMQVVDGEKCGNENLSPGHPRRCLMLYIVIPVKDERRIGRETPVVRKTAVWDTCRGEKVFVGYPRRWSILYLVTPGRRKIKSGETGSGADCCL